MISFIARSVPFLKICYRCFFLRYFCVFFNFNFCFCCCFFECEPSDRATFYQLAGRQIEILCRHYKQTHEGLYMCMYRRSISYNIVYSIRSSSTPTHTHKHILHPVNISCALSLSLCCGCHPITHVPAAHRVCRSPRISMDSYQAWVACYNYTQTHTHTIYLSI